MTEHIRTFGEFLESEGILALVRETQKRVNRELRRDPPRRWKRSRAITTVDPCVFLSAAGRCTVYEDRPIECSGAYVSSPPNQCSDPAATGSGPFTETSSASTIGRI
jgi:hypothetical protein